MSLESFEGWRVRQGERNEGRTDHFVGVDFVGEDRFCGGCLISGMDGSYCT